MPTRPTDDVTWATNANYASGTEAGNPSKVEPPVAQRQDGWRPEERPPAQYQNWWQNLLAGWIAYFAAIIDSNEEHTYQTPKARRVFVGPRVGNGESGWLYIANDYVRADADGADLFIDLDNYLPSGAVLTQVKALVRPGASRTTTNRMEMKLFRAPMGAAFDGPAEPVEVQVGGTIEDVGSNAVQILDLASLTETVDRDVNSLYVHMHAGNTAGTSGQEDRHYGLRLYYADPGPRNA